MAFPASTQIKVDALQALRRAANQLKSNMQTKKDMMAAQSVSGAFVISILVDVKSAITTFNDTSTVPGIAEYVQDQYNDDGIDVVAEFAAMKTTSENVRDWIITNLPKANGYLAVRTMDATGKISDRMFSPADTANLRTQMEAVIGTIG